MARYHYYCGECRNSFELDWPEGEAPLQAPCPSCGNEKAMKAFSAEDLKPPASQCVPGSGC